MRVLLTPRKWVQIKPSRRHAEARVGPESDRHTGPESDCHRQSWVLVVVEGEFFIADQCDGARVSDGVHP